MDIKSDIHGNVVRHHYLLLNTDIHRYCVDYIDTSA